MKEHLDPLEKAVIRYLRLKKKKSYRNIAQRLGLKPSTVRKYVRPYEEDTK